MNIQIPYNELSGFVRDRFNQNLVMNFVDEKTISIGKEIRVAMLSKLMGGLVEELDGNTLVVHLQKIEQLKDALKTVALGGLSFDKTNANVQVQMR